MGMIPLGKLLPERVREAGVARNIVVAQILAEARGWIATNWGAAAAGNIAVKALIRGELVVATDYPVLARELKLSERDLIRHINSKFGADIAVRLRFGVK